MTREECGLFLDALLVMIQKNRDFELWMAYLNVLVKVHDDLDADKLELLLIAIKQRWSRLEGLVNYNLAVFDFSFRS